MNQFSFYDFCGFLLYDTIYNTEHLTWSKKLTLCDQLSRVIKNKIYKTRNYSANKRLQ